MLQKLLLLCLFLLYPSLLRGDIPYFTAHRGASSDRPENTMAAFEYAYECGAKTIEFDFIAIKTVL